MWPAPILSHLNARLPFKHEWAFFIRPKRYSDGVQVSKGVWTGVTDFVITLDGITRTYEGAQGALSVSPVRYSIGTKVMTQDLALAVSPEGLDIVLGHDTKMAPCDLYCFGYDPRTMTYLGARRFMKGYCIGTQVDQGEQGGNDSISVRMASIAEKGTRTTTGYKSNESQKDRLSTDKFRKWSSLGGVANDPWGVTDED